MSNDELKLIIGGAISGNYLNYLSKLIMTIFDIGKSIGSSINYIINGKRC